MIIHNTKLIQKSIDFAKLKHRCQIDDEGKDYFESHIHIVACLVRMVDGDEAMICAAYLHDILEDTATLPEELLAKFGKEITDLVLELTHEGKKDQRGYYFPRLYSQKAIMIKFADRMSNLSRMSSWPEDRKDQYLRKSKFWKSE